MVDLSTLALFSVAALALTMSPGPDMLLIASRSASQGRIAGFATLAGIQAGTYCHALAAALGLSQLFLIVPVAYDIVRYAGAAYLLWLAWKTFRSNGTVLAPTAGLSHHPIGVMFRQGLLTNLFNPKIAVFYSTFLPQFIEPGDSALLVSMLLAGVHIALGVAWLSLYAWLLDRAVVAFRASGVRRALDALTGTVLVGLGLRLAAERR